MNELALFAGAGGGILGGKLLGWRTVCAVERDAYAAAVLAQRQNDGCLEPFPIWSDVETFDGEAWRGIVDVVSGGFPCQDISAAGKGAGISGKRSGLWREFARIIGEVRPRYVLVENSPVLTDRGLGTVLGDLAALGYDARWECWAQSTLAPRISGKESGSWQTPVADDALERTAGKFNSRGEAKLSAQVKLWPTPLASMSKGSSPNSLVRKSGASRQNDRLDHAVMARDGGQLNPSWVEWLMGWPIGWTACEPLAMDKCHCAQQWHGTSSPPTNDLQSTGAVAK